MRVGLHMGLISTVYLRTWTAMGSSISALFTLKKTSAFWSNRQQHFQPISRRTVYPVHATHLHGLYSANPDTTGVCFSCLPLSLACTRYSSSTKSLSNRFAHLTNYSVNKKNKEFTPNTDETVCQGHKWCVFTYVLYAFLFPTLLYTSLMQNTYIHSVCIRHIRMYTFITCLYTTANVLYAHLYSCVYACATAYVRMYVRTWLYACACPFPSPLPLPLLPLSHPSPLPPPPLHTGDSLRSGSTWGQSCTWTLIPFGSPSRTLSSRPSSGVCGAPQCCVCVCVCVRCLRTYVSRECNGCDVEWNCTSFCIRTYNAVYVYVCTQ